MVSVAEVADGQGRMQMVFRHSPDYPQYCRARAAARFAVGGTTRAVSAAIVLHRRVPRN